MLKRTFMTFSKKRIWVLICLGITGPLGLGMWQHYEGWGQNWVRYYLSGSIYEIIWCLVLFFFWPYRANIVKIPAAVFIATCTLEFLQLWKVRFLEELRATLVGAAIIGTDFVWLQFPFYALGAAISLLLLAMLAKQK